MNAMAIKAGLQGTNDALAKSWLNFGRMLWDYKFGAIVVTQKIGSDQHHVGIAIGDTGSHIKILGGNQGPRHEGRVKISSYNKSSFYFWYMWPN